MVKFEFKEKYTVGDLIKIMAVLRGEGGCPWDAVQTHSSIKMDLIEEAYEAYDAVIQDSADMLKEELGDLLLQVVFHSRIEEERGSFDFSDVADEICKKLIVRHPHVFGDVKVNDADEVLKNWDSIKKDTKEQKTYGETLEAVPKVFPALMRSAKLGKRAFRAGVEDNEETIETALPNLLKSIHGADADTLSAVLFYTANLLRLKGIDPEEALNSFNERFIKNFCKAENNNALKGKNLYTLSIDQSAE